MWGAVSYKDIPAPPPIFPSPLKPPIPAGDSLPQKGSPVGIYDGVYATSTIDLRLGYFSQSARVPLHPIQPSCALYYYLGEGGRGF
jgi:hypothetical protein